MLRNITAFILLGSACTMVLAKPARAPQNGESARYICADGRRIEILYGGGGAVVTVAGIVAQLDRAATDEEIYAGGGWTWSVTGKRSGLLTAAAAPQAIACQVG